MSLFFSHLISSPPLSYAFLCSPLLSSPPVSSPFLSSRLVSFPPFFSSPLVSFPVVSSPFVSSRFLSSPFPLFSLLSSPGGFQCDSQVLAVQADNIYTVEPNRVQVRTPQVSRHTHTHTHTHTHVMNLQRSFAYYFNLIFQFYVYSVVCILIPVTSEPTEMFWRL